jgi:hypothetical protein
MAAWDPYRPGGYEGYEGDAAEPALHTGAHTGAHTELALREEGAGHTELVPADPPALPSVLSADDTAPVLHRGRAGRRRQTERWKKNRRRAAAATAVALFGGGLTVAAMPHASKGHSAAAAPEPISPSSLSTDGLATVPSAQTAPRTPAHADPRTPVTRTLYRAATPARSSTTVLPATTQYTAPSAAHVSQASYTGDTQLSQTSTSVQAPAPSTATSDPTPAAGPESSPPVTSPTTSPTTTPPPTDQLCLLVLCVG